MVRIILQAGIYLAEVCDAVICSCSMNFEMNLASRLEVVSLHNQFV